MKIQIIVFDGVDELDFVGPYEVFQRACAGGDCVSLVTTSPADEVTGAFGVRFRPDGVVLVKSDLMIVPGGGWIGSAPRGLRREVERGLLQEAIATAHANGSVIAGVCAGVIAVASAGLLNGRPAVTHRNALKDLTEHGANLVHARIVDDGDVVTSGGVTSGIDLALWLVERFWSAELSREIAGHIEYSRTDRVHFGPNAAKPEAA